MTSIIKTTRPQYIQETRMSASGQTPAGGTRTATVDISKSGYTPLAILGASTFHGSIAIQEWWFEGTTARVIGRNTVSTVITNSYGVRVLYKKND